MYSAHSELRGGDIFTLVKIFNKVRNCQLHELLLLRRQHRPWFLWRPGISPVDVTQTVTYWNHAQANFTYTTSFLQHRYI